MNINMNFKLIKRVITLATVYIYIYIYICNFLCEAINIINSNVNEFANNIKILNTASTETCKRDIIKYFF